MLKISESLKELRDGAGAALRDLLAEVPTLQLKSVVADTKTDADLILRLRHGSEEYVLLCEAKSSAQPRQVRDMLYRLRNEAVHRGPNVVPVLIAPYLSPEVQTLCSDQHVGYLDLEGNAHLAFDTVYIDRRVPTRPPAEQRALRSLFKPRAAQLLRVLLRQPGRAWRVTELAQEANVSLGHVSNVRHALIDREWARPNERGLILSQPDALLDAWRDAYEPPPGEQLRFYTHLHGEKLEDAAKHAFNAIRPTCAYASFSAARWLAPYARNATVYFYADLVGVGELEKALKLSPILKGENVEIHRLDDRGLFLDIIEPAPGILCTSAVQTYLDLAQAGERGREAAQHLRLETLDWSS